MKNAMIEIELILIVDGGGDGAAASALLILTPTLSPTAHGIKLQNRRSKPDVGRRCDCLHAFVTII